MNNRKLILALIGVIATVPAFAGVEHASFVAQVVKHVVPYESFVWNDGSSEVIVLVRVNETGLVQELGVETTTGQIRTRSEFDRVSLLKMEPLLIEGEVFGSRYSSAGQTKES